MASATGATGSKEPRDPVDCRPRCDGETGVRLPGAASRYEIKILIDCGACVPVCPVTAIFTMGDLPEKWNTFIEINKNYVDGGKF